MKLEIQTIESAPTEAREALTAVRGQYGFIPNLMAIMANAPSLLKAYHHISGLFEQTSLTSIEQQVVLLAVSAVNRCEYCVAAHSMTAKLHKVPGNVIEAIRDGRPIADSRLEALRSLTAEFVESRGWPKQEVIDRFLSAGYPP